MLTRRETIAECVLSREDLRQLCVVCTLDPRGTSSLVGKIATVRAAETQRFALAGQLRVCVTY